MELSAVFIRHQNQDFRLKALPNLHLNRHQNRLVFQPLDPEYRVDDPSLQVLHPENKVFAVYHPNLLASQLYNLLCTLVVKSPNYLSGFHLLHPYYRFQQHMCVVEINVVRLYLNIALTPHNQPFQYYDLENSMFFL